MTRFLFAAACAFGLSFGAPDAALGVPPADTTAAGQVDFPAAADIRPGPGNVGPIQYATGVPLIANDVVSLEPYYGSTVNAPATAKGGAILSFSVHGGGNGNQTVLASNGVNSGSGSDVSYADGTQYGVNVAVSPAGLVYYFDQRSVGGTGYADLVELNPSTLARRIVSDGTNASLGPVVNGLKDFCWDLSTNTVLCFRLDTNLNLSLIRINPATGVRTTITVAGVTLNSPSYLTTDAFGNLFYLENPSGSGTAKQVVIIPAGVPGAGNFNTGRIITGPTGYYELGGMAVDPSQSQVISGGLPASQSLVFGDAGVDQTTSAIYRVASSNGTRATILNNATNTTSGTAVFDLPAGVTVDTTGKIYYEEYHNAANGSTSNNNTFDYLTFSPLKNIILSGAQNIGYLASRDVILVPPPQPAQTASTSNVLGTTATLNGNITADGGVANSGIIARGFVYAPTAANSAPKIGGTGVTQLSNFTASSLPVAQNANLGTYTANLNGLNQGTSYTVSTYAQNVSGFNYSAPLVFVTATSPTVTTNSQPGTITGNSALLGGNVTGAGGGNATITTRGIVYAVNSTNPTPTIGGTGVTNLPDASATTGTFSENATGLASGTTYAYRAYATNQVGTSYGSVRTFTTFSQPTANSQTANVGFNTATPITLTGSDPNNPAQTLTYQVTTSPTHGTLSGTPPNLTYTPTAGYNGTDSFQFTVTNTSGLTSNTATMTLNVARGTPTANSQSVNVNLNLPRTITLTGTDPDSPALSLTYTVVTQPTSGTLSGTAPNLTYTPNAGYTGADGFTFRVSNGTNTSAAATVSLTVVGQPTISSFTPASGPAGTLVTVTGTNLQNATGLNFFRNVEGTNFTVVSSTQVTVRVPAGATTGTLTILSGSGTNSSSTKFTVTP